MGLEIIAGVVMEWMDDDQVEHVQQMKIDVVMEQYKREIIQM